MTKRILALCDDIWHPAAVVQEGLAGLEKFGYQFDWIEDANEWSADRMAGYPVTLLSKANNVSSADDTPWMIDPVQDAFLDYVKEGNGLLAVHSGTVVNQPAGVLHELLGGIFKEHPEQCPVTIEPLASHPVTAGSEAFTLVDEHYFMDMASQPVEVFLNTKSEHGTQPGGWRRQEGDGRVCVLTPGHNQAVWQHPSYQVLLLNALGWCSGAN